MFSLDILLDKGFSGWAMLVFLIGSILWIVTSGLSLAPLIDPQHAPKRLVDKDSTVTGLVGSVIFLLGAIVLVFEVFSDDSQKAKDWLTDMVRENWDEEKG